VDKDRSGGLTAYDTRRQAYGAERRAILTWSPELHAAQAAGFAGTTLAKAGKNSMTWPPPWPAQDPPQPGQSRSRDRPGHPQALGPPGHHLAAGR